MSDAYEYEMDLDLHDKRDKLADPARGYINDAIGQRMKGYEKSARTSLPWRMPVIIRVDGKAFHSLTKRMAKPFDARFMGAMDACARAICEEAQGAVLAYIQSDEISILLHNYRKLQTTPWFDNQVQKMVSVAASVASAVMTRELAGGSNQLALFDGRAFVLPEAEVCNYFIWRQQDATRNSIQMLARSLYSDQGAQLERPTHHAEARAVRDAGHVRRRRRDPTRVGGRWRDPDLHQGPGLHQRAAGHGRVMTLEAAIAWGTLIAGAVVVVLWVAHGVSGGGWE